MCREIAIRRRQAAVMKEDAQFWASFAQPIPTKASSTVSSVVNPTQSTDAEEVENVSKQSAALDESAQGQRGPLKKTSG